MSKMEIPILLSSEIVAVVLDDLAGRKGLDIEELVDDTDIYEEIVDTLIERVHNLLLATVGEWMQ